MAYLFRIIFLVLTVFLDHFLLGWNSGLYEEKFWWKCEEDKRLIYSGPFDQLSPNQGIRLHPLSDAQISCTNNIQMFEEHEDEEFL